MGKIKQPLSYAQVLKLDARPNKYYTYVTSLGSNQLYVFTRPNGSKSWCVSNPLNKNNYFTTLKIGIDQDIDAVMAHLVDRGADYTPEPSNRMRSFMKAGNDYLDNNQEAWANKTYVKNKGHLLNHAFPVIGKTSVNLITVDQIAKVLEPLKNNLPTSKKVRELIGRVIAIEYKLHHPSVAYTNPTDTDLLKIKYPHLIKPPSDNHFEAIDWQIAPDVFAGLDDKRREHTSYSCLSFVMLTACRSEEARLATWDEISADGTMWNLPADRMTKTKVRHVVPLSTEAQKLLHERRILCRKPEGLIFPSPDSAPGEIQPLTSDALLRAFQRTCGKATVHGLRSTFMDWGMDHEYSFEALDKCLAHKLTDKVAAAYRRTSMINLRRPIMQDWGNFLISKIG